MGMLTVLFLLVLALTVEAQVYSTRCSPHCIERECNAPNANPPRLWCSHGCEDGYYGGRCNTACPLTCTSCHRYFEEQRKCFGCKDGYYLTKNKKACTLTCPIGCSSCFSATNCTACKSGYYKVNTECQQCLSNCASCTSGSNCTECHDGFYSTTVDTNCSSACPASCHSCSSSTHCISCKANFNGTICENCVDGKYGINCETSCPSNCLDSRCDRDTGNCLNCPPGYIGNSCDLCEDGKYGTNCDQGCSLNCLNKTCARNDGACIPGCINQNFKDGKCTECTNGFYSFDCTTICPEYCMFNICDQEFGNCTYGCEEHFTGDYCDQCEAGKHGVDCDQDCSNNCRNNTCERDSGTCSSGCVDGYSGDKCCIQNLYCSRCATPGVCEICVSGMHGDTCDVPCVGNCSERGCDKGNGSCHGCVTGFYGDTCNKTCSGNCNQNACSREGTACLLGCRPGYTGPNCSGAVDDDKDGPPVAAIVGGVAGGVVALLIILFIVIMLRRRRSKHEKDEFVSVHQHINVPPEIITEPAIQQKKASFKEPSENKETEDIVDDEDEHTKADQNANEGQNYMNVGDIRKRVAVADLETFVADKPTQDFLDEFKLFPWGLVKPYEDSRLPQNRLMNRYRSIYPYNDNRVKMRERASDYINASYIEGYKTNNAYIACLGPTEKAMDNFWLFWDMVWQERIEKIVMLTNLLENMITKCERYWPNVNVTLTYGLVSVTNVHEEVNAEYIVRNFSIEKDSETRVVSQVHFTAWPDKGVPDHVTSIIEFHGKVKSLKHDLGGPILVHCSAGIGRTGTYIALDMLTAEGEDEGYVDVFNCVMTLRYQRINMVQTLDQYIYLHKAVVFNLTYDSHSVPASKFQEVMANISLEEFEQKFERLNDTIEKMPPEEEEAQRQNMAFSELNRKGTDIPGNRYRPRLFRYQEMGEPDYINAVYINSFKSRDRFIAAQTPLPGTVVDFVKLILQENCKVVVNLEPEFLRTKTIGDYLPPDNETVTHGQFKLSSTRLVSPDAYSLRELAITQSANETETIVHCFQFNAWPAKDHVPKDHVTFLCFMKDVKEKARELNTDDDGTAPILLHCLSGAQKCGLFCALHNCVEKMESEQEVSVGNIVRQIRFRRRSAFPNKDQLIFCYKAVSAYLESCNTYSNFDLQI